MGFIKTLVTPIIVCNIVLCLVFVVSIYGLIRENRKDRDIK